LTQFVGRDVINKNTTDLAVCCSTGSVELCRYKHPLRWFVLAHAIYIVCLHSSNSKYSVCIIYDCKITAHNAVLLCHSSICCYSSQVTDWLQSTPTDEQMLLTSSALHSHDKQTGSATRHSWHWRAVWRLVLVGQVSQGN